MKRKIRPIRIEGNLAYVPLTQGYEAVIDAADVKLVGGFNWQARVAPHTVYAGRSDRSSGKNITILMHRVIMQAPNDLEVDHISCHGLNNCRQNLRLATGSENMHNQRISRANASGYKGVSWSNSREKWCAQISLGRKRKLIGRFSTPEEAHAAYVSASAELHGAFGRVK